MTDYRKITKKDPWVGHDGYQSKEWEEADIRIFEDTNETPEITPRRALFISKEGGIL